MATNFPRARSGNYVEDYMAGIEDEEEPLAEEEHGNCGKKEGGVSKGEHQILSLKFKKQVVPATALTLIIPNTTLACR